MLKTQILYDVDFNLWVESQLVALREQRYEDLDLPNLLEEIEGLTRQDKKSIRSYLKVLFTHLLKWQYQPLQRSNRWSASISNSRIEIEEILEDSPSLKSFLPQVFEKSYLAGREIAAKETDLPIDPFPESCPYRLEQVLDRNFYLNLNSTAA